MSTARWKWFSVTGIHALLDGDHLTGYRVRAALNPTTIWTQSWRNPTGKFDLLFPGGDAALTYDSLQEALDAAEFLYQRDPTEFPPWIAPRG